MKKSILNFGKILDKTEQKQIKGGTTEEGPHHGKCRPTCIAMEPDYSEVVFCLCP